MHETRQSDGKKRNVGIAKPAFDIDGRDWKLIGIGFRFRIKIVRPRPSNIRHRTKASTCRDLRKQGFRSMRFTFPFYPIADPCYHLCEVCPRKKSDQVQSCLDACRSQFKQAYRGGCSTLETRVRVSWSPNPTVGQSGTGWHSAEALQPFKLN